MTITKTGAAATAAPAAAAIPEMIPMEGSNAPMMVNTPVIAAPCVIFLAISAKKPLILASLTPNLKRIFWKNSMYLMSSSSNLALPISASSSFPSLIASVPAMLMFFPIADTTVSFRSSGAPDSFPISLDTDTNFLKQVFASNLLSSVAKLFLIITSLRGASRIIKLLRTLLLIFCISLATVAKTFLKENSFTADATLVAISLAPFTNLSAKDFPF